MAFGIYVHIPYCIQRCTYCDFATYEQSQIFSSDIYVELLVQEIRQKHNAFQPRVLDTLYFGGGTPSLLPSQHIVTIIEELAKHGFSIGPQTEVTIEINPATVDKNKLKHYIENGINRFSVGAQTFDNALLKMVRREHNAQQTLETLELLSSHNLNYTFDILFGLPRQTIQGLKHDLSIVSQFSPSHISAYCLTVPENHPLSKGRPPENEQLEMFDLIRDHLHAMGIMRYEISNFARPGFESRHNMLYWNYGDEYWGLGLSAHSYSAELDWGARYWNVSNINSYREFIEKNKNLKATSPLDFLPEDQFEKLEQHQALTDFCHISLRLTQGLSKMKLRQVFAETHLEVEKKLQELSEKKLLRFDNEHWALTESGVLVSNQVFSELTFLKND